ncbi:hypothetical protein HRbin17_01036 [bacterium HR17]|uniref:Transglutaminase-like domain-containing protein n=1 Tax=Candidatus Fervidibacter japonicus TaxID=2035412 RepID=A0A2H5XBG4_9BACT|nr:hypothetical protein HRbin17_01036 [bacterium HR17]
MGRKAFVVICACLLILVNCSYGAWWIELSSPNPADGPFSLRWGQKEPPDADKVPLPPRWLINGDPCCFKVGATVRLSLKQDAPDPIHGRVVGWGVGYLTLYSRITGQVLRTYPDAYFLPADQPYDFGPLVEWIEYAQLEMAVYVVYESGWAEEGYHGFVDEIFIVLDAPKAPMDPAWVSVLRISCEWARGESTNDGAANMLAQKLWENGEYNGGYTAFTRYVCDGSGNISPNATEYFYLREFIANRFVGQCNDFADFLVCLITSVGAFQAAVQRTHPLGSGAFHTEVIDPAGSRPSQDVNWQYHQFCIYGTDVWDGCLSFVSGSPQGVPKKLARDTVYYDGLVAYYLFGQWQPSPPGGFIPGVYASSLPQWCSSSNPNAPCGGKGYGPNCPSS